MEGERVNHGICVDLLLQAIREKIFTLAVFLLAFKILDCIAFVQAIICVREWSWRGRRR